MMDGVGGLITDLPEVNNEQTEFRAITIKGVQTFNASELVRADIGTLRAKLII